MPPSNDVFTDVLAKLGHAGHHAQAFHHAVEDWANGGAYSVETERDPDTGEEIIYAELTNDPPRGDWGLLIGDIVHNARSALDALVYVLVDHYQGPPPPDPLPWSSPWKRIACPVITDESNWSGAEASQLWGIPPSVKAAFQGKQPFVTGPHAPRRESLAVLNELWNIDKHRRVHLAEVFVSLADYKATFDGKELATRITARYTRSEKEGRAEIGRVSHIGHLIPPPDAKVDVHCNLTPEVAFDQAPPTYGARVLDSVKLTVSAALDLAMAVLRAAESCPAPPSPNRA